MIDAIGYVPPAAVVLLAALLAALLPRGPAHAVGLVATVSAFAIAWVVPEGPIYAIELFGFEAIPYAGDAVARLMGIIFAFIGTMAVLYSAASDAPGLQTAFALSYVGASLGAVFSGDWLTLIVWWELMAVTSTLLVWHYGGAAVRAGFRYALLHGIGGSLLLAAVVWHVATLEELAFSAEGIAPGIAQLLAAIGIGVNVGFIGLHAWLPDTYPRPHVAASVFLCVYTTKTGVFAMYRAFPEGHLWIAYMGGGMAVFGAFVALLQQDMRRLLSYHIQSQVGYMVAGVGIGTTLASAGAFAHVFNHILYKSLLFMAVGVVIYRTGRESLKEVGGLARRMPLTAITFFVAAFSIAGFPGFNGFVSKGMVIGAAHHEHLDVLWYLLLIGGVGTFLSFIKLGYQGFIAGEYDGFVRDATPGQSVAMIVVAALCVFLGLYPPALTAILPAGAEIEYTAYTIDHLVEGFGLAVAGLVGFAILRDALGRVTSVPDIDAVYNPVSFYLTRWLARGVTDGFAAVDRTVLAMASTARTVAAEPGPTVRDLPGSRRLLGDRVERAHPLRADIGAGLWVLVVILGVLLLLAVVL